MNSVSFLRQLCSRFDAVDAILSRKLNMLIFLLIRFLLMSAMVVGFSWLALDSHP